MGAFDEEPGFLVDITGQKGRVGVAVYAADERRDIDIDNVAIGHNRVIGNAVANDLVQ